MTSSPPTINTAPIRSPVRASALSRSTSANLICHGSSRSTGVMLYLPQIAKSSGKKTRVDQPILFCIEEESVFISSSTKLAPELPNCFFKPARIESRTYTGKRSSVWVNTGFERSSATFLSDSSTSTKNCDFCFLVSCCNFGCCG